MPSIDEVIARSRQPGAFAERRRFTVARQRAIQKMRKFALASPVFYILELIQAAISNGATYVDIDVERSSVFLTYIGGHFTEEELGQLFDFLFASKERLDFADVRLLALGINSLLLAEPDEVVIESGDGTLGGTTRIQIDGRSNTVEVGTPTRPLNGTFLRAVGINRRKLGGGDTPRELSVIEERCLSAPVPIIVNTRPIFGFTSSRCPRIFGVGQAISFDEGDLYGTVGFSELHGESEVFKLLTWGVWIESVRYELLPGFAMCGVVNFDRLHKTADHSAIVQDDRLLEMWTRLLPYARQLESGQTGQAVFDISLLDGTKLSAMNIRELVKEFGGAVVVPAGAARGQGLRLDMAQRFGGALRLPVLLSGQDDASTLRLIAGPEARVVEPDVLDAAELEFYQQPPAELPPRPWLTGAVEVAPIPVPGLLAELVTEGLLGTEPEIVAERRRQITERLRESSEIRATIYTPEVPATDAELWVEVWTTDRRVWMGSVRSPFPGHTMVVRLPDISPRVLLDYPWGSAEVPLSELMTSPQTLPRSLSALVARGMSRVAFSRLQQATERALASVGHHDSLSDTARSAGSAISRIAIAALARSSVKRLRSDDEGKLGIRFTLLDPELPRRLLEVPILETLDGRPHSIRDLEATMARTCGLVYGVVPGVEPDLQGLDRSRIYNLDLAQERLLVSLVGEASYVRVDQRDEIVERHGLACRDVALGLREYPEFPLLVEGRDPTDLGRHLAERDAEITREGVEASLVVDLHHVYLERTAEELRRQAARHLIWYLGAKLGGQGGEAAVPLAVDTTPLFLDVEGNVLSFSDIREQLLGADGIVMQDGWAADAANLGALTVTDGAVSREWGPRVVTGDAPSLAMNPFAFHVLSRVGTVRPALDMDLSLAEAVASPDSAGSPFLSHVAVQDESVSGEIGVPAVEVGQPAVAVVDLDNRRATLLRGVARELGVVGRLRLTSPNVDRDHLEHLVRKACLQVLEDLVGRITTLAPGSDEYARCMATLLRFASRSVQITAQPGGSLALDVSSPIGQRILDLPFFATTWGVSLSAHRLLVEWISRQNVGDTSWVPPLSDDVPHVLRAWLDDLLTDRHVVRPAGSGRKTVPPPEPAPSSTADEELARWLSRTLALLRTDPVGAEQTTRVVIGARDGNVMRVGSTPISSWRKDQLHQFTHLAGVPYLVLDGTHWLVERTRQRLPTDPEAVVWLLLACYAHINDVLEPVTNEHEVAFHRRVLGLLEQGKLGAGS